MNQESYTYIIIEDEVKARKLLEFLINKASDKFEILGAYSDLNGGLQAIHEKKPDVVFLDVHLPNNLGIELFDMLDDITFQTVFVTAYDEYAIKAFELSAVDYLLKPIRPDRLQNALSRVETNIKLKRFQSKEQLENSRRSKITLFQNNEYITREIDSITCVKADRSYCNVFFMDDRYTLSKPLNKIEELLDEHSQFIRVHRSWIVNKEFVNSVSLSKNEILLENGVTSTIGKSFKKEVKRQLIDLE